MIFYHFKCIKIGIDKKVNNVKFHFFVKFSKMYEKCQNNTVVSKPYTYYHIFFQMNREESGDPVPVSMLKNFFFYYSSPNAQQIVIIPDHFTMYFEGKARIDWRACLDIYLSTL